MVLNNDQNIILAQNGVDQNGKFPKKVWGTVEVYKIRNRVDVRNLDISRMRIVKVGIDKLINEIKNLTNLNRNGICNRSDPDPVVVITNRIVQTIKEEIVYGNVGIILCVV